MARYYMNLHECGVVTEDLEGVDLPDASAAAANAMIAARDVMAGEVKSGALCLSCKIVVLDKDGHQVAEVYFRDALNVSGL
ncbi:MULTISPECIES: hypothetical protein [unclassified Sphingomonas]|jgi:hypothetical protein|uniref:DUF6894 family protein n=1 Tax=unclassified Sphingomonas TaxID=196159 RepID=UPI001F5A9617|nr:MULTISPECIES: hypothetical protein [unclassified Sphingomonas]